MGFYHLFQTKTTCFGHKIMTTSCENDFNTESQSLLLIIISVSLFLYVLYLLSAKNMTLLQSLHHSPESFCECCLGTSEVDTHKSIQGIAVHLTIVEPHTMGIEFLY